jgi:hypothetical protein
VAKRKRISEKKWQEGSSSSVFGHEAETIRASIFPSPYYPLPEGISGVSSGFNTPES